MIHSLLLFSLLRTVFIFSLVVQTSKGLKVLILLFEKFMTDGVFKINDEGVLCNIGLAFSHFLPFVDDVRVFQVSF